MKIVGLLLSCILVIAAVMTTLVHTRAVSFKRFGTVYSVTSNEIPTYMFEDDNLNSIFFRGYFEMEFAKDSKLTGRYSIVQSVAGALDRVPPIAEKEHLTNQRSFQLDATTMYLPKGERENITFRFYPQFKLNINPYSIRAFIKDVSENNQATYIPIFPKNDDESPTLGPWVFSIPSEKYVRNYLRIEIYAYSDSTANYGEFTSVMYPRWLDFSDSLSMKFSYADVLDPKTTVNQPAVKVEKYKGQVTLYDDHLAIDKFVFTQRFIQNGRVEYRMGHPIKLKKKIIDPFSVKCAYATSETDFKQFLIDDLSAVVVEDSNYVTVSCIPNVGHETYVLTIVGKPIDYNYCYGDHTCQIMPNKVTNIDFGIHVYMNFNPDTQLVGEFSSYIIYGDELEQMKKISTTFTQQSPLKLVDAFRIDFSGTRLNETKPKLVSNQNTVNLKYNNYHGVLNSDPYSFRLFKLNQERQIFELVSEDIPSLMDAHTDIDIEKYINQTVILAAFDYEDTSASIGNLNFVYYSRDVTFKISEKDNLNVYFKEVYSQSISFNKRPYFTVYPYTPENRNDLKDFVVLYSFMQQNGNGLESYGFDEGRKFTISKSSTFKTNQGVETFVNLDEMKCVYLFKETQFYEYEFSSNQAFPNQDGSYTIDCEEDIRDESFVFMLVAKPLEFKTETHLLNETYELLPTTVSVYSAATFTDDTITLKFQPYTTNSGKYTVSEVTDKLRNYKYLPTKLPLTVIGGYLFDFTTLQKNDQDDAGSIVSIIYNTNTSLINVDPFSYKFMRAVDEFQDMTYFFSSDEPSDKPWVGGTNILKIDRLEIAVLAYMETIGKFGESYSLHYERTLQYQLDEGNNHLFFHFSSEIFPTFNNGVDFVLEKGKTEKVSDPLYTVVKSFQVNQKVKSDILTKRQLHFNRDLKDISGNAIDDFNSLQCLYISANRIIYGNAKLFSKDNSFTLECSETITIEQYEWVIVANKINHHTSPLSSSIPIQVNDDITSSILGVLVGFLLLIIIVMICLIIVYFVLTKKRTRSDYYSNDELVPLEKKDYQSLKINDL